MIDEIRVRPHFGDIHHKYSNKFCSARRKKALRGFFLKIFEQRARKFFTIGLQPVDSRLRLSFRRLELPSRRLKALETATFKNFRSSPIKIPIKAVILSAPLLSSKKKKVVLHT
jgi:hypothetical protein